MFKLNYQLTIWLALSPMLLYSQVFIKGQIDGIPGNKIYLMDAYTFKAIDSAKYDDHSFLIKHETDKDFEPTLGSLYYINKEGHRQIMGFTNPYAGLNVGTTAFMIEKGNTVISGTFSKANHNVTNPFILIGGQQTQAFLKTERQDFGYINEKDSIKRRVIINDYCKIINSFPFSFYLLDKLYNSRQLYSKEELSRLINCFNVELRSSIRGIKVLKTISILTANKAVGSLICKTIDGKTIDIFHKNKKQVIIFWASWCGPCRKEIPHLKELNSKITNKSIEFVSVSIDNDKSLWLKALKEEQMKWSQYIIDSDLNDLEDRFHFSYIPLILIIQNGTIIKRFEGFDESEFSILEAYINKV